MKKVMTFVLALLVCLSLCACSQACDCGCEFCCGGKIPKATTASTEADETNADDSITQTEPVKVETADAALAVEDFEITKIGEGELWFRVKIRNISDADLERITFEYQVLDKNGDILRYQLCGASTVAAGQAIWAGQFRVDDLPLEEVGAMSFVSDWGKNAPVLKEKVVFRIEDYT